MVSLVGLQLAAPSIVAAQEPRPPRVELLVGVDFLDADLKMSFYAPLLGKGAEIDYEDTLGLDSNSNEGRLNLAYRIGERRRHEIELAWLRVPRSGSAILSSEIQIGDDIFEPGLSVSSGVITSDLVLDYNYYVLRRRRGELAIGVGIHDLDVVARSLAQLQGRGLEPEDDVVLEEEIQTRFPLPVAGMKGSLRLSRKLLLRAGFRLLAIEIGAYGGRLFDGHLRLEHETFRRVSLGIGYVDISLYAQKDAKDQTLISSVDYEYRGGELFLRLRF